MRMNLVKGITISLLSACALVSIVGAEMAPGEATQGETVRDPGGIRDGRLEGTWEMQISVTDCAGHVIRSFPSVVAFMAGGTMIESQAGRPQAQKTPGEGVWHHTTGHDYGFRFKFFTFDAQNVFTGWTIIAGETTVDRTGDANLGSANIEIYDPNGNLIATACAEIAGTRFEV
jgi:hypothetical protein